MFKCNKYTAYYFKIINNAVNRNIVSRKQAKAAGLYVERHHILPKSIWPEHKTEVSNLVFLTAKEHFIVHLLLTKMVKTKQDCMKMAAALNRMLFSDKDNLRYKPCARIYEYARFVHSASLCGVKRPEHSAKMKLRVGYRLTEETKRKIGLANKGKIKGENNPMKRPDVAKKVGEALREKYKKHGYPMQGKKHTQQTKLKMSANSGMKRPEVRAKFTGANHPNARAVVCVNTQQVFPTVSSAALWCGLEKTGSDIAKCCKGKTGSNGVRCGAGKHPVTKEQLFWRYK